MPRLTGVFEQLPNLDKISAFDLQDWLSTKVETHYLVNFLGNRIIYPQTIPLSQAELEIDLAILREGLKLSPNLIYNPQTAKFIIPAQFLERFPRELFFKAVIEALKPKGVNKIFVKGLLKPRLIGSVIGFNDSEEISSDDLTADLEIDGLKSKLNLNTLTILKYEKSEGHIKIGTKEFNIEGGDLGLIIDLRFSGK